MLISVCEVAELEVVATDVAELEEDDPSLGTELNRAGTDISSSIKFSLTTTVVVCEVVVFLEIDVVAAQPMTPFLEPEEYFARKRSSCSSTSARLM